MTIINLFRMESILLGQCKDGLPFLLDLSDPASGPVLISGDQACGKTHQLQVLVESAVRIHKPSQLQLSIFTHNPTDWGYLVNNKAYMEYLQDVHAWYDGRAEEKIKALIDLAEKRRDDQVIGPKVMLILDDLNFVEDLSFEAQTNLRWLIAYGAQSGVWIIAAVKSRYAKSLTYWLEPFRTRILGKISSTNQSWMLAVGREPQKRIMEPSMFRVWTGSNWMTYQLPLLGS